MRRIVLAAISAVFLVFGFTGVASADSTKECVTVVEGKNKNFTDVTTEVQRSACPSNATHPGDTSETEEVKDTPSERQ